MLFNCCHIYFLRREKHIQMKLEGILQNNLVRYNYQFNKQHIVHLNKRGQPHNLFCKSKILFSIKNKLLMVVKMHSWYCKKDSFNYKVGMPMKNFKVLLIFVLEDKIINMLSFEVHIQINRIHRLFNLSFNMISTLFSTENNPLDKI